jgi:hypothetical protein
MMLPKNLYELFGKESDNMKSRKVILRVAALRLAVTLALLATR